MSSPVNSKDLQKDTKLNEFLNSLGESSESVLGPLVQLLDLKEQKREGKKSIEQGTVKPLYFKDFVSSNKLVPNDFEEKELLLRQ